MRLPRHAGVVSLVQERTNKRLYHLQEVVKLQASPSDRNIILYRTGRKFLGGFNFAFFVVADDTKIIHVEGGINTREIF